MQNDNGSLDRIPTELRDRPQWVVWRLEHLLDRAKPTKVPYQAASPERLASTADPATWSDFDTATDVGSTLEGIDGIGYVFSAADPYTGLDLDGELPRAERDSIALALSSYTEVSPSGHGYHVIVRASVEHGRHPEGIGVFTSGRYFTMTGLPSGLLVPDTIEPRQAELDAVLAEHLPPRSEPVARVFGPRPTPTLGDGELIARALDARNGQRFAALWRGELDGHPSESEADLALCSHLAYWTGGDAERIDRLFRQSGRMRPKWERADYRTRTIERAVSDSREPSVATTLSGSSVSGSEPFTHARIIDMAEAMRTGTGPLPYRVRPFALDATVTLLVGRSGESKTFLGLAACAGVTGALASVEPLMCAPGRALYLDAENGPRELGRRFATLGLDPDAFTVADGSGLRLPADIEVVRELVAGVGANLLVLDSMRRLAPGVREDKSDDIAPLMAALATLARGTGCAVVGIHHRSTKQHSADVRGSSTWEDQADAVFVFEKVRGDPEHRTRRRLRCTKMRPDIEPPPMWLRFPTDLAGRMTVESAEPFDTGEASEAIPAHEVMADAIRDLAPQVVAERWLAAEASGRGGRHHATVGHLPAGRRRAAGDGRMGGCGHHEDAPVPAGGFASKVLRYWRERRCLDFA